MEYNGTSEYAIAQCIKRGIPLSRKQEKAHAQRMLDKFRMEQGGRFGEHLVIPKKETVTYDSNQQN